MTVLNDLVVSNEKVEEFLVEILHAINSNHVTSNGVAQADSCPVVKNQTSSQKRGPALSKILISRVSLLHSRFKIKNDELSK